MVDCPICLAPVQSQDINAHIDSGCEEFFDKASTSQSLEGPPDEFGDHVEIHGNTMTDCPICSRLVKSQNMNDHIDSGCKQFLETASPSAPLFTSASPGSKMIDCPRCSKPVTSRDINTHYLCSCERSLKEAPSQRLGALDDQSLSRGHAKHVEVDAEGLGILQLCPNCSSTNIDTWLDPQRSELESPLSGMTWLPRASLQLNCDLCRFLGEVIRKFELGEGWDPVSGTFLIYDPDQVPNFKLELIPIHRGPWTSLKLEFYRETVKSIGQRMREARIYIVENLTHLHGTPTEYARANDKGLNGLEFVRVRPGTVGSYRESTKFVDGCVVKSWMSQCRLEHNLCKNAADKFPVDLFLIDTANWCLYRVLPHERLDYVALSYVWGGIEQPQLSSGVVEVWQHEGSFQDLTFPQTIRNAITLTAQIGLRYLWVDSLCIYQDDDKIRRQQIDQMYLIYSQCSLAIIAAHGDDCNAGLPGIGEYKPYKEYHSVREISKVFTVHGFSLGAIRHRPEEILSKSAWRTRGWTFQEELCAPRAVVFLTDLVIFSCPEAVWREDVYLEEHQVPDQKGLNFVRSFLSQRSTIRSSHIQFFRELVDSYLQRQLTLSSDIENAFAGIGGLLKPYIGPMYCGIPESIFAEILNGCWFWDEQLKHRPGFPSWSWTGYERGGITPAPSDENDKPILVFFKLANGVHRLGLNKNQISLHDHFEPSLPDLDEIYQKLKGSDPISTRVASTEGYPLIAFYSSSKMLEIQSTLPSTSSSVFWASVIEYKVFAPGTKSHISTIRLPPNFVTDHGRMHQFIIIAHVSARSAFRLMMIRWEDSTAYKVNVTVPGRLVKVNDWWDLKPEKTLVVMS